ncbi:MAG: hypothetical protein OXF40_05025 [Rhodospirillales bacterium]|nr:hypothetical protein [Rhodospirillales bacterium]
MAARTRCHAGHGDGEPSMRRQVAIFTAGVSIVARPLPQPVLAHHLRVAAVAQEAFLQPPS